MGAAYKVLGQSVTAEQVLDVTNKEISSNVVTLTTATPHKVVVGQPVTLHEVDQVLNITNKELTSNVAILTTDGNHRILVGQNVTVAGVDATFNGTYGVTAVTANTFSYAKINANIASTAATGTVTYSDLAFNGTYIVDSDPTETTFTYITSSADLASTVVSSDTRNVIERSITNNVATLTTSANHEIIVGQTVVIADVDAVFNGTYVVTAVTNDTFSYVKVNANISPTGSNGTVTYAEMTESSVPWVVVYECPLLTSTVISNISICNQTELPTKFSIAISDSLELGNENILFWNDTLDSFDTIQITGGIVLDQTVKYLLVGADLESVSINAFGSEVTS